MIDAHRYHPCVRERFADHMSNSGLIPSGATVVLGYSGGADSTCLLSLMAALGIDVVAVHLHHGMRAEADEELEKCEEFCKSLGIEFLTGRADVPALAQNRGIGVEEAGRIARYAFFEQCAMTIRAELIATAHTMDDHVETVLFNLVRGTGLKGLSGIPEVNANIVRPLLKFTREETRRYCQEKELWFHDDPANFDQSFSRVKLRERVVPALVDINKSAKANIAKCAKIVGEEDRFLDGMAAALLEESELQMESPLSFLVAHSLVLMDRARLTRAPRVLLARAVRLLSNALGATLDYDQSMTIVTSLANEESKGSVTAEGGAVVVEWNDQHVVCRDLAPTGFSRLNLEMPGTTSSETLVWRIEAAPCSCKDYVRTPGSLDVVLCLDALKPPFHVRPVEQGETVVPLGSSNPKRIVEVLSAQGVPEAIRPHVPVVCDLIGPVWIPGGCLAERTRVSDTSRRCVRLTFGPN